jgi:Zn finger protein HypA/HybF involved in hydrogenase expression
MCEYVDICEHSGGFFKAHQEDSICQGAWQLCEFVTECARVAPQRRREIEEAKEAKREAKAEARRLKAEAKRLFEEKKALIGTHCTQSQQAELGRLNDFCTKSNMLWGRPTVVLVAIVFVIAFIVALSNGQAIVPAILGPAFVAVVIVGIPVALLLRNVIFKGALEKIAKDGGFETSKVLFEARQAKLLELCEYAYKREHPQSMNCPNCAASFLTVNDDKKCPYCRTNLG